MGTRNTLKAALLMAVAGCSGAEAPSSTLFETENSKPNDTADSGSDSGSPEEGAGSSAGLQCVPGQSIPCVGVGGCEGGQVCRDDGRGYGTCDCGDSSQPRDAGLEDGDSGPINNGGDPDPLPYDCETTFACDCTPQPDNGWCREGGSSNPNYQNLYNGCKGRPKHCVLTGEGTAWWCCKY